MAVIRREDAQDEYLRVLAGGNTDLAGAAALCIARFGDADACASLVDWFTSRDRYIVTYPSSLEVVLAGLAKCPSRLDLRVQLVTWIRQRGVPLWDRELLDELAPEYLDPTVPVEVAARRLVGWEAFAEAIDLSLGI
jgi:hypothetical protein